MGKGARPRLPAALLLPLLLLALAPVDLTRYLCSMDGAVRAHRCCPPAAAAAATSTTFAWDAPSCCAVERVDVGEAPARALRDGDSIQAFTPIEVPGAAVASPPRPPIVRAPDAVSPPGLGPPMRLRTQTFLI